jgi:hypothetical protein
MSYTGAEMSEFDPKRYSTQELLNCFAIVLDELRAREVIRTRNNPVSDYAEWLVAEKLGLKLQTNATKGYDAIGPDGKHYQIKARRLERSDSSRQLGIIRNLESKDFDYLAAVLFDNNFEIKEAYLIPHRRVSKFGSFSKHQNGHILQLKGKLLEPPGVKDITSTLKS